MRSFPHSATDMQYDLWQGTKYYSLVFPYSRSAAIHVKACSNHWNPWWGTS